MRPTVFVCMIALAMLTLPAAIAGPLETAVEAMQRKDFKRAFELFRPLAEKGDATAQGFLGDMYNAGDGVAADKKAAVMWWTRAAEKGEQFSQLSLGDSYATGRGVVENWTEATKWWRKAAEQNVARAQTGLGLALYSGRGVKEDKVEAAKWFAKAADQDDAQAQANLARMYVTGEGGLPQSLVEAHKWTLLVGDRAPELTVLTRGIVFALRKTQEQEAIRLAEQWKFEKGKIKEPPKSPVSDKDLAARFFVKTSALFERCTSTKRDDIAWCDGYIAGAIDLVGSRRELAEDGKDARICLNNKSVSLREARQAVMQALTLVSENRGSPIGDAPASNSVMAGLLVYLCK